MVHAELFVEVVGAPQEEGVHWLEIFRNIDGC